MLQILVSPSQRLCAYTICQEGKPSATQICDIDTGILLCYSQCSKADTDTFPDSECLNFRTTDCAGVSIDTIHSLKTLQWQNDEAILLYTVSTVEPRPDQVTQQ